MVETDLALLAAKLVDEMREAGTASSQPDLNRFAAQISNRFQARKDEFAILRISSDARMLCFLFPSKLSQVGTIPLNSPHSLAVKTIRDQRGEIVNNFPKYRHQTVFESVHLSAQEEAAPIQKIMSSPMIVEGKAVGVIQISRKVREGERVGPDFTPDDLAQLATVCSILGKYLAELPPPR